MIYWIIGIVVVSGILYFLDREVYFYEGTHMGSRIQSWLYDRWAAKYDKGKAESQARDAEMLARPVLDAVKNVHAPLILDLATGTGRFPLALLREPEFDGHVVAVDVSVGMLDEAAKKLAGYEKRFTLLRKIDYPLPFPDSSFDVVSCMEALEVMPEMESPLKELHRILRPGGMFITSRGTDASGRAAKVRSVEGFRALLEQIGFERVEIVSWWRWFDRVIACKPGEYQPSGNHAVSDVLTCENCQSAKYVEISREGMKCSQCGNIIPINRYGVIMM